MIGIYGGTFDPVHYGHLRTALEVSQAFQLTELRFVPCQTPPHRGVPAAGAEHRLAMLRLAIAGQAGFLVDERELNRPGPSFMFDTMQSLHQDTDNECFCLVIGMDAFLSFHLWHRWQELSDLCHIVVMTRPGYQFSESDTVYELAEFVKSRLVIEKELLNTRSAGLFYLQVVSQLEISATQIRALCHSGGDLHYLLPDRVIEYINEHHLYV